MSPGASAGMGKGLTGIWGLAKFAFTFKGALSVTLIILVITSFGALIKAIETKSAMPFFRTLGKKLLNHDTELYEESVRIEQDGGLTVKSTSQNWFVRTWATIKSLGTVIRTIWIMYFFFVLFYALTSMGLGVDASMQFNRIWLAVILLLVFEILAHFIVISEPTTMDIAGEDIPLAEKFVPFRGLIKFGQVSSLIFKPIYDYSGVDLNSEQSSINETMLNQTADVVF